MASSENHVLKVCSKNGKEIAIDLYYEGPSNRFGELFAERTQGNWHSLNLLQQSSWLQDSINADITAMFNSKRIRPDGYLPYVVGKTLGPNAEKQLPAEAMRAVALLAAEQGWKWYNAQARISIAEFGACTPPEPEQPVAPAASVSVPIPTPKPAIQ